MYTVKKITYNEKEIHSILKVVTGVGYSPSQIKIVCGLNNSKPTVDFVCSHSSTNTLIKLEEFLECQGYSRSYSDVRAIYNKPWWKPFWRKIIGFSLNAKI